MKREQYYLCFSGTTKTGKKEICPLYKDSLDFIDQFTTYGYGRYKCLDEENLYNALPDDIKRFIRGYFDFHEKDLKKCFFIRKVTGNKRGGINSTEEEINAIRKGRNKLPVIFYNDADVVYANDDEVLDNLLFFNIPLEECNEDNEITEIKKSFFKDLFKMLSLDADSDLSYKIDSYIGRKNDFSLTRLKGIMYLPETLNHIAAHVSKRYLLKRKVLLLIKEYKVRLSKIINCSSNVVNPSELYNRIINRKFNYELAVNGSYISRNERCIRKDGSFREILSYNRGFFEANYGLIGEENIKANVSTITIKSDEKIIEELSKIPSYKDETYVKIIRLLIEQIKLKISLKKKLDEGLYNYEEAYNKCVAKITELDTLRLISEKVKNDDEKQKKLNEDIIHLKMNKFDLEKSLEESIKNGNESLINDYSKKIADYEELILGLEKGDFYYSDAGFLVRKEDVDDDMKM